MPQIPKFLQQTLSELDQKYSTIKRLQQQRLATKAGSDWSVSTGLDHERNRYSNIVPYDKTRVKLKLEPGFDDYINASKIKIDLQQYAIRSKTYIASQGPTETTTNIFWQMCYDEIKGENIVIVMVTPLVENGFAKCFKYWPNDKFVLSGDGFDRELVLENLGSHVVKDQFVVSQFKLTNSKTNEQKNVYHLYYDQWQDFSKPTGLEPVMLLSEYANKLLSNEADPLIVHCSAGVGRSGTFITLNYLLTCGKVFTGKDDDEITDDTDLIEKVVYQLREQRLLMVERFQQFAFIYESLRNYYIKNLTDD